MLLKRVRPQPKVDAGGRLLVWGLNQEWFGQVRKWSQSSLITTEMSNNIMVLNYRLVLLTQTPFCVRKHSQMDREDTVVWISSFPLMKVTLKSYMSLFEHYMFNLQIRPVFIGFLWVFLIVESRMSLVSA